ncbi:unnamed protein product, partial [marine sediment metagenome]
MQTDYLELYFKKVLDNLDAVKNERQKIEKAADVITDCFID